MPERDSGMLKPALAEVENTRGTWNGLFYEGDYLIITSITFARLSQEGTLHSACVPRALYGRNG